MISLDALRVAPGAPARLRDRRCDDTLGVPDEKHAEKRVAHLVEQVSELQGRLWAEGTRSVLLVLQGMDASGKDGTVRRVFTGVNPQGVRVVSFKAPTEDELKHDYLWRVHGQCPRRGEIGIFNRSHYEDVVTAFVFGLIDDAQRRRRFHDLNEFERMLNDEGTTLIKVFLNITRAEQEKRFRARLADRAKRWKYNEHDLEVQRRWDDCQDAYDDALSATSSEWAPWYVVPADHKWVRNVAVATLLANALQVMDPQFPDVDKGILDADY